MAAISVERFVRVMHPHFHRAYFKNRILTTVVLCWILLTGTSYGTVFVPYLFNLYPYDNDDSESHLYETCTAFSRKACNCVHCFPPESILVETIFQYVIPIGTAFYCYGRSMWLGYRRVLKAEELKSKLACSSATNSRPRLPSDPILSSPSLLVRFFRTPEFQGVGVFLIVLMAFFVPWGPHAINRFISPFGFSTMDSEETQEAH